LQNWELKLTRRNVLEREALWMEFRHQKKEKMEMMTLEWQTKIGTFTERSRKMAFLRTKNKTRQI